MSVNFFMEHELILYWAIAVSILLVILLVIIILLRAKHSKASQEFARALTKRQTQSNQLGQNTIKGEFTQILGAFSIMTEYKQLASISSVSKQFSIDLLGIKDDSLDFIEVKTQKGKLSKSENKIKKLIENKQVRYRIIEGNFPEFSVKDRK